MYTSKDPPGKTDPQHRRPKVASAPWRGQSWREKHTEGGKLSQSKPQSQLEEAPGRKDSAHKDGVHAGLYMKCLAEGLGGRG